MPDDFFIIIPVPMLKQLTTSPNGYKEILAYGLYKSARKQRTDIDCNALRQLVYCYYRRQEELTMPLLNWMRDHEGEEWWPDYDYCGFSGDGCSYDPELEMNGILEVCQKDDNLKQEIWEWHDIRQFCQIFFPFGIDFQYIINIGREYPEYDKDPYAKIHPHILHDYATKYPNERGRIRLAMLLSVCSIVGNARFAQTTKNHITMRMFGCWKQQQFDEALKDERLKVVYEQYTTRKMFDALRNELMKMRFIRCYQGYAGRIYVSTRYEFDKLADEISKFIYDQMHAKKETRWQSNNRLLQEKLTALNKGAT